MATKKSESRAKRSGPASAESYKNKAVAIEATRSDPSAFATAVARKLTRPEVSAAAVIESWQKDTHDVNELVDALAHEVSEVNAGSLARAEAMLISQAHALDNIFCNLARRATSQEYLKQWEAYMRMAMKAQSQCRMTLEALATMKNPPVVFAKQANISAGHQQVNNGPMPQTEHFAQARAGAHAGETESVQNGLLEALHDIELDTRAQSTAGGADPHLEALAAGHRATHP